MALKLSNNGSSSLAGAITAAATAISVSSGEGARFPALGVGDWFMATLVKIVAGAEQREIVKVTARTGDALTVVRAQEGTVATTFSAGDRIENRLTAGTLSGEFGRIETKLDTEVDRIDTAIASLSNTNVNLALIHASLISF